MQFFKKKQIALAALAFSQRPGFGFLKSLPHNIFESADRRAAKKPPFAGGLR
ncbi:MAG: hypothetical protein Q4E64_08320 [Phascolarctobacterium sp.]|uniref:hypothetical protein n=1 Tax=Phascolarctobacterium sp. TaxID=2049039 RepID=UPI0026DDCC47|nr:hypothetical protein [Phascolarctobacterium sp.]MDO4921814.1 hypothetical protein [Phascolarctobacterium sp.]